MESNIIVQGSNIEYSDGNKTSKRMLGTKSKEKAIVNPRNNHKFKKHTLTSYTDNEDVTDKDIILRMVLPGYNWFEEQVKSNMYTSDGEKRIISPGVSVNPKLKVADQGSIRKEPINTETPEQIKKQKSILTKRVINSTFMLLPNNSLPLKKRKIKVQYEEIEMRSKELLTNAAQENKKLCNPPIQKVTPILNNSTPLSDSSPKPTVQPNTHTSAFKNDHLQKKSVNPLQVYNSYLSTPSSHSNRNSLESCLYYPPIVRKNPAFMAPDPRSQYQVSCQPNNSYCYNCNLYRLQAPHLNKMPSQECLKSHPNYQPNRAVLPPKGYATSNYYRPVSSYDPLALPEIRQSFCQAQPLPKVYDSFMTYPPTGAIYHADRMPLSHYNINPAKYYTDHNYWNKQYGQIYKPMGRIDSTMVYDYNSSNLFDPSNITPMMHSQPFPRGYNHIG